MFTIFANVIARKNYDLAGLLNRIDQYHIEGKLTDNERDQLYELARDDPSTEFDANNEIVALWAAVRALQATVAALQTEEPEPEQPAADEWPEFVQPTGAHDCYNVDNKVTYNGQHYASLINGNAWSPAVYPAGWQQSD